jgi:hypothetical protein
VSPDNTYAISMPGFSSKSRHRPQICLFDARAGQPVVKKPLRSNDLKVKGIGKSRLPVKCARRGIEPSWHIWKLRVDLLTLFWRQDSVNSPRGASYMAKDEVREFLA